MCQSFFFNKFAKFVRTPFLIEHLRWLLLKKRAIPYKSNHNLFLSSENVLAISA